MPAEEIVGAASLHSALSDSLVTAAEESDSVAAVVAAARMPSSFPQEAVSQLVETTPTTASQVCAAAAREEEVSCKAAAGGSKSSVVSAAAVAERKERSTVLRASYGSRTVAAAAANEGVDGVAADPLPAAAVAASEERAAEERAAAIAAEASRRPTTTAAGKTDEAAAAAAGQEGVARREEVQQVFYELVDAELLLIEQHASKRLHAYHPWEHLARLLPLWKDFEFSVSAAAAAGRCGSEQTAASNDAQGTSRYRPTWRGSDTANTPVSTASSRSHKGCLNCTSSTVSQSSEGVTVSVKNLQPCCACTVESAAHGLSSPQPDAPANETPLWDSASTGSDNSIHPCQRPAAAAVTASETCFLNQIRAANGDQLSATCSGAAAEEFSMAGASNVETANHLCERNCPAARKEKGNVLTLEAATQALVLPREVAATAAIQETETAGVPATGRQATLATDAGGGAAKEDAVTVDASNAAFTFGFTSKKERQNELCQACGGSKAPVVHTHVNAERETFVDGLQAKDDHEIEEGDAHGKKAMKDYKGNVRERKKTSQPNRPLDAEETSISGRERNLYEERRAVNANNEEPKPGKLLVNEEVGKTKQKGRTVNQMVDAFVQRQLGMLPQCRAPHHMLARRFYEQLQSRMTQVNYCLSEILSADVLAAAADAHNPGAAVSQSSCVGLKLPTRSIPRLLSESTFPNASVAPSAAAGTARTVVDESGEIHPFVCASELQLGGHNDAYFALSSFRGTHMPVSPAVAVLTDFSKGACDSGPVTHSGNTVVCRSTLPPYKDGAAGHLDTMAVPDQSSPPVPAVMFRTKEALLGRTYEKEAAADDADAARFGKKGLPSTQRTELTAEVGRLPSENGFSSALNVQEQLLRQYLETNYEVIKLFPQLEAPWSGRSDLYTAYLRMWSNLVAHSQRRIFLYKSGGDISLQETWKPPNKWEPHRSEQQQRQKHVQPKSGHDELCAIPTTKSVPEVAINCEVERFVLEADSTDLIAARQSRRQQLVLSLGDAVEDHLKTVVRRELATCNSLLPLKRQDQRNGRIRVLESCISGDLGTATRRERKISVSEPAQRESGAESDPIVRWMSRHQARLCRELSRAIEAVRRALRLEEL